MFKDNDKHEFFNALMFYTRLPVPSSTPYSPELLNRSRKYFTVIGLIIGGIASATYLIAQILLPASIAVLISMIISILATGAFHEDGFADSCDALGGGWGPEQILTIMKDSRIGTYGTAGLMAILALKASLLMHLTQSGDVIWCLCVIAAHSTSRQHASRLIKDNRYVQDIDKSKIKPIASAPLSSDAEQFSVLVALVPCVLLAFYSITAAAFGLILSYFTASHFMEYCNRRVGGYTGDILGAIQQLSEVFFLLVCTALI